MAGHCHAVYTASVTLCLSQKVGHNQTRTGKKPCLGLEHVLELAAVYLKALVRPRWVDVFVA